MADGGDDSTLIKIAVFGITMSLIATACIALLISPNNDYDYESIEGYRNDLANFSGKTMINNTPWILQHVFTPWTADMPVQGHIDSDGWLYGDEITGYPYIGQAADIKLSPDQKSNRMLSTGEQEYSYISGKEWWAGGNDWGITVLSPWIADSIGLDSNTYASGTANVWNYTGYRYVFDPTLPFAQGTSSVDGALSIVWYSIDGSEGLSGGLQIYNRSTLIGAYDAQEIVSTYEGKAGYATTYDFDFEGVILKLSIRFDQAAIDRGLTLWDAWTSGNWSMAISSTSAGNFFDVKNSNAFMATTGSMIDTFIGIYTMSLPSIENPWMDVILWLLVGLPMTLGMACVTLRIMRSVLFFV